MNRRAAPAVSRGDDIARFVRAPVRADSAQPLFSGVIFSDPFATRAAESAESRPAPVAGARVAPRRLTAILITDDRRVAVIDDSTVAVGDVLRDGARVSAIHADRVWVVDPAGQWRALMLLEPGR